MKANNKTSEEREERLFDSFEIKKGHNPASRAICPYKRNRQCKRTAASSHGTGVGRELEKIIFSVP